MSFTVYKFNPYIDLPGRKVKRLKRHRHYLVLLSKCQRSSSY